MSVHKVEKSWEQLRFEIKTSVEDHLNADAQRQEINAQYEAIVQAAQEQRDAALRQLDERVEERMQYLLSGAHMNGF